MPSPVQGVFVLNLKKKKNTLFGFPLFLEAYTKPEAYRKVSQPAFPPGGANRRSCTATSSLPCRLALPLAACPSVRRSLLGLYLEEEVMKLFSMQELHESVVAAPGFPLQQLARRQRGGLAHRCRSRGPLHLAAGVAPHALLGPGEVLQDASAVEREDAARTSAGPRSPRMKPPSWDTAPARSARRRLRRRAGQVLLSPMARACWKRWKSPGRLPRGPPGYRRLGSTRWGTAWTSW